MEVDIIIVENGEDLDRAEGMNVSVEPEYNTRKALLPITWVKIANVTQEGFINVYLDDGYGMSVWAIVYTDDIWDKLRKIVDVVEGQDLC